MLGSSSPDGKALIKLFMGFPLIVDSKSSSWWPVTSASYMKSQQRMVDWMWTDRTNGDESVQATLLFLMLRCRIR